MGNGNMRHPLCIDRQTRLQTLPSCNFVGGGSKCLTHWFDYIKLITQDYSKILSLFSTLLETV